MLNWFQTTFSLFHIHKWDMEAIENMLPFERQVYIILLKSHMEKEKMEAEAARKMAR